MTIDSTDRRPPPEMTGSSGRVAHMRNWVEQLEQEIARLQDERDALWRAISVLDPDGKVPFAPLPSAGPAVTLTAGSASVVSSTVPIAGVTAAPPSKVTTKTGKAAKRPTGRPRGRPPKPRPDAQPDATVTQIRSAKSARTASRDYGEIAAHIIEFRNSGTPVTPALVKLYKVPESTAKNWIARCREMGLLPPVVANLKVIEDHTVQNHSTAVYNAREVADAYLEAARTNRRPIQFVADSLGIDKALAVTWVRQARIDGQLAPADDPQLPEAERTRPARTTQVRPRSLNP